MRTFLIPALVATCAVLAAAACAGSARSQRSGADTAPITAEEVRQRLAAGEALAIVDARSEKAWQSSDVMAAGAVRIPPGDVDGHVAALPRGKAVVTYCT